MMAIEKALDINFEMTEIGEIVEIGTFIFPFRWCKKPQPSHLSQPSQPSQTQPRERGL